MQCKKQLLRADVIAGHIITATDAKRLNQRRHQHPSNRWCPGEHQPRHVMFQIRTARPLASHARTIDRQLAVNRIYTVKFTIKAQKIAGNLDRAIV